MDGAGRQHYLAGHDRLEALVNQLERRQAPARPLRTCRHGSTAVQRGLQVTAV